VRFSQVRKAISLSADESSLGSSPTKKIESYSKSAIHACMHAYLYAALIILIPPTTLSDNPWITRVDSEISSENSVGQWIHIPLSYS
jgi:hypothetical protein